MAGQKANPVPFDFVSRRLCKYKVRFGMFANEPNSLPMFHNLSHILSKYQLTTYSRLHGSASKLTKILPFSTQSMQSTVTHIYLGQWLECQLECQLQTAVFQIYLCHLGASSTSLQDYMHWINKNQQDWIYFI